MQKADMHSETDGEERPSAAIVRKLSRKEYDMEVSMLLGALKSFKKTAVVNPFPKDFIVEGDRQYGQLSTVATKLPGPEALYGAEGGLPVFDSGTESLLGFLEKHSNLKEVGIETIAPYLESAAKSLTPQHVFEVVYSPQRAAEFDAAAKEYGTDVGFHGSQTGNWFCISKNGLRNFSGTQRQTNGALFGEGVYLSRSLALASDFSAAASCWPNSQMGEQVRVVAQCDWVTSPQSLAATNERKTEGGKVPEAYIVIPNSGHVRVTRLLVYSAGTKSRTWQRTTAKPYSAAAWVVFYLLLLVAIVISQSNTITCRSLWRQARSRVRYFANYAF